MAEATVAFAAHRNLVWGAEPGRGGDASMTYFSAIRSGTKPPDYARWLVQVHDAVLSGGRSFAHE